jgi:hypothetical protein
MYTWTGSDSLNTICAAFTPQAPIARCRPFCHTCTIRTTYTTYPTQPMCRRPKILQERVPAPNTASQRLRLPQHPNFYAFHHRHDTSQRSMYSAGNKHHLNFGAGIFFQMLAHPVFKMWIIQEPNKVALWNKRQFEGEKTEITQHVLKCSVRIFVH